MKSTLTSANSGLPTTVLEGFAEITQLIALSRDRVIQSVNTGIIDLYWKIGERISRKIAAADWGDGVVEELAAYLARSQPGMRGFTRANLFRMRQFYETYRSEEKVAHWRDNYPGPTIWSSLVKANFLRSESSIFGLRSTNDGAVVSLSVRWMQPFSNVSFSLQ